jgi:F0F1-type ATP synthase assembly protein I
VDLSRFKGIAKNLTLAGMLSQIGCLTAFIAIAALGIGLWIDSTLNTKPIFTIILLLLSIPVSVFVLIRVSLDTAAQIQTPQKEAEKKEGEN